jgi:hypothetical protein
METRENQRESDIQRTGIRAVRREIFSAEGVLVFSSRTLD